MSDSRPTAIDLFCGAGGLSVGLQQAGFRVVAGVEVDSEVATTFSANHPGAYVETADIRKVRGRSLLRRAGVTRVDLVAGCPPCQGFSTLTSKYHRRDPRNNLVIEMGRIIAETRPRVVMMENVPGLAVKGKRVLGRFIRNLKRMGYKVNTDVLQLADFGIPQSRRRLVLLAGMGFDIDLPKKTRSKTGGSRDKRWLTLRDVLKGFGRPRTLSQAMKRGGPEKFNWHVIRDVSAITKKRLKATAAGASRYSLPNALRPKCHADEKRGFPNVYGRLRWNRTPPTMTGGCTTLCKGRFGHPSSLRTISVREAAAIQTFPRNFRIATNRMDKACDMVGNALPPKFARIAGKACLTALIGNPKRN